MACGERVLLPKVREPPPETLVVSDGFSCRSQIEQGDTGRRGLHVAQVIKLGLDRGAIRGPKPEDGDYGAAADASLAGRAVRLGFLALAAGVAAAGAVALRRRR